MMTMFHMFLLSMKIWVKVMMWVNVIRVLLLSKHLREYEFKKCYIQNKACMVQAADPTIYSPMDYLQSDKK